jgi:hypothetical protein
LQISGGVSAVAASKVNFSPFYSDSTAVRGGVVIRDHAYLFSGASHTQYLVGGTGRADVSGLMQFASSQYPAISASFNALAYGGFESANYTAEWTLASGAVRSTAEARTGSYSLSFPASSGVTPSASCLIPCKPGQIVNGDYYYKALNITGTSGSFYAQIDYMDKGGNVISNVYGVAVTTTNVSAWTRVNLAVPPAPSGTVNVKLFWNIFGTTSGAPTAYIDDINAVAV